MTTTIPEEPEKEIIERLENGEDRDDIILDLAERRKLDWKEAEALVDSTQAEHADDITLAQSPLLVLIALSVFIGGLFLVGVAVYDIAAVYDTFASAESPAGVGFFFYLFTYGGFFWEIGLLGMGMIVGSLRGLSDVWAAIFAKLGIFQEQ